MTEPTNNKTMAIALASALMALSMLAGPTTGHNVSDDIYIGNDEPTNNSMVGCINGTDCGHTAWNYSDDQCSQSTDADGFYEDQSPTVDDSCDADDKDSTVTSSNPLGPEASVVTCTPGDQATFTTDCTSGFIFRSDDAFGAGNFGGDWPFATSVVISADAENPNWGGLYLIRTEYRWLTDMATDVEFTDITPSNNANTGDELVCLDDTTTVTVDYDASHSYDAPPGSVIQGITGFRVTPGNDDPCKGIPNGLRPLTVHAEWTYAEADDDLVVDVDVEVTPIQGDPTGACEVDWFYTAGSSTSDYAQAQGVMTLDASQDVSFDADGPRYGTVALPVQVAASGVDLIIFPGEWAEAEAVMWNIGSFYEHDWDREQCPQLGEPCEPPQVGFQPNCVTPPEPCDPPQTGFEPDCSDPPVPCEPPQVGFEPECLTPCDPPQVGFEETGCSSPGPDGEPICAGAAIRQEGAPLNLNTTVIVGACARLDLTALPPVVVYESFSGPECVADPGDGTYATVSCTFANLCHPRPAATFASAVLGGAGASASADLLCGTPATSVMPTNGGPLGNGAYDNDAADPLPDIQFGTKTTGDYTCEMHFDTIVAPVVGLYVGVAGCTDVPPFI